MQWFKLAFSRCNEKTSMSKIRSVITGDLVKSRDASEKDVDATMTALTDLSTREGQRLETDFRFTRHRGDGWQILLPDAASSLDLSILIAAALHSRKTLLSTKIAVGLGTITTQGTQDLSDASGDAFVASGDLLEDMSASSSGHKMAITGAGALAWHRGVFRVTDWMIQNWSERQAEAVYLRQEASDMTTNADRAASLNISRQAYEARYNSSGFAALDQLRDAFLNHNFRVGP